MEKASAKTRKQITGKQSISGFAGFLLGGCGLAIRTGASRSFYFAGYDQLADDLAHNQVCAGSSPAPAILTTGNPPWRVFASLRLSADKQQQPSSRQAKAIATLPQGVAIQPSGQVPGLHLRQVSGLHLRRTAFIFPLFI